MTEQATARVLDLDNKVWPDWQLQPPPEDSPGVGPWVYQKYQMMRKYRDSLGLPEVWLHNHELYRNRQFKRHSKFTQVPVNLYFKTINTLKANLSDSKPRASIMPHGDTDDRVADGWQARYDLWWEHTKQQQCLQESIGWGELYGFQCEQMVFNPDMEGGLGEVETVRCDPFSVFFWPRCLDIQKQPMMAVVEAMELGEIYAKWPEAQGKVNSEAEYSDFMGESRRFVRGNQASKLRPLGTPPNYYIPEGTETQPADAGHIGVQRALVIQLWVRDYTTVPDPEVEDGEKAKYPGFMRCTYVTNKGNFVLQDGPNPSVNPNLDAGTASQTYLWDKFPFLKRLSYSDGMSEYGLSVIEQIEPLINEVSKKLTMYGVHLDTQCRTPLILPQGCGVKKSDISNKPARILEPVAVMAQHIKFLQVPQATADILGYINLLLRLIEIITGLTDVSEGRKPAGVTSGVAIAELQEKAQTIYREKIRNLDIYLEEQGRMFISLGQNWYTEERKLLYEGKKGQEEIDFRGTDYQGELAFHVESGSTLPRNRAAQRQETVMLAEKGLIDPPALLKELNFPQADEVVYRLQQGPVGMALDKLRQSGMFDDATLQAAEAVLRMDDATFKKEFVQSTAEVGV